MDAATPERTGSSPLPRIALALAGLGVVGAAAFAMMVASLMGGLNAQDSSTSSPSALAVADIPPNILPLYLRAGQSRGLDWAYLAAIGKIETDHGRSNAPGVKSGVNAFGCCAGPMQFSVVGPSGGTWGTYGVDGNHDGQTSVYDPADAIPAAADYLKASGAPGDWDRAIFAYNHAAWYVADVKRQAQMYRDAARSPAELQTGGATTQRLPNGAPWLVVIPGTTARCDSRIARDVMLLMDRYKLTLGDCYAPTGHEANGEHPLGLGLDVTPAPGGSWALLDELAHDVGWSEACAASGCDGTLPPPFRFVGWNGYSGHGDPAHAGSNAHLHLSWAHSAATAGHPATIVQTLLTPGGTP
jgi:hypothetical protein